MKSIDWKAISKNLSAVVAAEGTILAIVPSKYAPYAHAVVGIAAILAGLFQQIPTNKEVK